MQFNAVMLVTGLYIRKKKKKKNLFCTVTPHTC